MAKLEILKDKLMFDGKPFYLASGDIHYFRFFESEWERRLKVCKDFGLTAIQTYVPWNLHEPEEGQFNFEGNLNIKKFLDLCVKYELKVMFRPAPYICSEWDLGGLPYWLLKKDGIGLRTMEEQYLECFKRYYTRLAQEFIPYLSTNGGPIIAVAVENEYGSFGDDREYIKYVAQLLTDLGVDVPMFTANGFEQFKMQNGSNPDLWTTIDVHEVTEEAKSNLFEYQPNRPIYVSEFWGGRSQQWGGYFLRQTPDDVARLYKNSLEMGAYVNFYMFCGGTNFGFMNGALVGRFGADVHGSTNRYIPFATSYDVDAPVTEYGEPTEKYYKCKAVLKNYMESNGYEFTGTPLEEKEEPVKLQRINDVKFTRKTDLIDNVSNLTDNVRKSGNPLTMETMNQNYGFIMYSTDAVYTDDSERLLIINGLKDRALVFIDGKYVGCYMRDRENEPIKFTIPKEGLHMDILVENMGRVNYGLALPFERKGIDGYVKFNVMNEDGSAYTWDYTSKKCWTNYSLRLNNLEKLDFSISAKENRPTVYEYEFKAEEGVSAFIDMTKWTKGVVYVNGFNLGRYWNIGPQGTLYIPGELLKENNTLHILELHNAEENEEVTFTDYPRLDMIEKTQKLDVSVVG